MVKPGQKAAQYNKPQQRYGCPGKICVWVGCVDVSMLHFGGMHRQVLQKCVKTT